MYCLLPLPPPQATPHHILPHCSLKLCILSGQPTPHIYWAWCQYDMKYPIGWFGPATLSVQINPILAEPKTAVVSDFHMLYSLSFWHPTNTITSRCNIFPKHVCPRMHSNFKIIRCISFPKATVFPCHDSKNGEWSGNSSSKLRYGSHCCWTWLPFSKGSWGLDCQLTQYQSRMS